MYCPFSPESKTLRALLLSSKLSAPTRLTGADCEKALLTEPLRSERLRLRISAFCASWAGGLVGAINLNQAFNP